MTVTLFGTNRSSGNGPASLKDWRPVLMLDPCVYCGGRATGLDHVVAASRGGPDKWTNRAPACTACDTLKADMQLLAFLAAMARARWTVRRRRYRMPQHKIAAVRAIVRDARMARNGGDR